MALLDMSSEITRKNVDTVLAFLPILSSKKAKLYNIQTESLTLDPYCYSKEFEKFIKALYQENFVISFDWTTWQNEAQRFILHPKLLNFADISTLQKLLTTHIRCDRAFLGVI
jgi:hypothetical protein